MPTQVTFSNQYAGNGTGVNAGGGDAIDQDVTITAVNDDGLISVGDQVTASGISAFITTDTGISDGVPFTYLGNGSFGGVTGYVFTSDGSLTNPDEILVLTTEGSPAGPTQQAVQGFSTDTSTQVLGTDPACFLEGTMIATPEGEARVETLQIGDLVSTADGRAVPVKWVGRQQISANVSLALSDRLAPVCITAGALGNHSDLYVSADHGMIVYASSSEAVGDQKDGQVINASALVNGDTVRFVPADELPEAFTYYHIETEAHDVILANGAPSETFIDAAGRAAFDNHQEYLDLYGAERIFPEMAAPRITTARLLPEAIKRRLAPAKKQTPSVSAA